MDMTLWLSKREHFQVTSNGRARQPGHVRMFRQRIPDWWTGRSEGTSVTRTKRAATNTWYSQPMAHSQHTTATGNVGDRIDAHSTSWTIKGGQRVLRDIGYHAPQTQGMVWYTRV